MPGAIEISVHVTLWARFCISLPNPVRPDMLLVDAGQLRTQDSMNVVVGNAFGIPAGSEPLLESSTLHRYRSDSSSHLELRIRYAAVDAGELIIPPATL
ncbi:MAG: hypothetical protein Q9190_006320 [Brigantiaea leucoxantha]